MESWTEVLEYLPELEWYFPPRLELCAFELKGKLQRIGKPIASKGRIIRLNGHKVRIR